MTRRHLLTMPSDEDKLSQLIQEWIEDGCPGTLLKVVNEEIKLSKEQLRKKLRLLSSDLGKDQDTLKEETVKGRKEASEAMIIMDKLETQVLPLLNSHLNDLLSLEKIHRDQREVKKKIQKEQQESVVIRDILKDIPVVPVSEDGDSGGLRTDLIERARELSTSDPFMDMTVGSEEDEGVERDSLYFSFPICRVSKSCLSLMDLIMQILDEAEFSENDKIKKALFTTVKKMLQVFAYSFPVKHGDVIENIPTASALFHNNCLFLAHFILTSPQIQELEGGTGVTCRPIMTKLQSIGEEGIKKQMNSHKGKIVDFFQAPEVVQCLLDEPTTTTPLKSFEWAVKKSVMMLKKLEGSWKEVLPRNVYNNMMSTLMTAVLEEIIRLILLVDDFSADTTDTVSHIMRNLRGDLPDLLREPHEGLPSLLPNAFKFLELEKILSSSLAEIVDRWGGGFGPLSVAFSAEQVKRLIRALFQDNQLRATALSKIRDL